MRADIHDGPEHMLQSDAGYIDARPLTPARQNLLQRTAGPYIRVKRRHDGLNQVLRSLIQVCFPRPFSLRDICRKDCSEVAVRSHFVSPAARRTPSTRSAL